MSITKIRFVTHAYGGDGYAAAEAAKIPLDADGVNSAEKLGHYWKLVGYRPDRIHTTPLVACSQTARVAACVFGGGLSSFVEVTEPAELHVTDESLQKIAAELTKGDVQADLASPEEAILDEKARALLTGGQLVRYAIGLREEDEPPREVIAVTDHYSINSVVSLTQVGLNALSQDPSAQLSRMLTRAPQEPCAESLLIAEGSQAGGDFLLSVMHVGHPTLE